MAQVSRASIEITYDRYLHNLKQCRESWAASGKLFLEALAQSGMSKHEQILEILSMKMQLHLPVRQPTNQNGVISFGLVSLPLLIYGGVSQPLINPRYSLAVDFGVLEGQRERAEKRDHASANHGLAM